MITRIQALRYRCFNRLNVQWGRYNVLAGANGSGKSTLLDIPQLFSEMLTRGVTEAFLETSPALHSPRAQSLKELTHRQRGGDFGFVLEAELPDSVVQQLVAAASPSVQSNQRRWPRTIRYETRFEVFNDLELQVKDECLWLLPQNAQRAEKEIQIGMERPGSWRPLIERSRGELATITFELKAEPERRGFKDLSLRLNPGPDRLILAKPPTDPSLSPATSWFADMLTRDALAYARDVAEMHKACPPGAEYLRAIRADAANLPWMVLDLKQERPDLFAAWLAHVQTALPNIVSIDAIRRADDSHAYLRVEYQGGYAITSAGLSGGTLTILALTILPYLTRPPELVCLEEPENGVHPRALEAILQSLSSLYNSQVWLSTHSPIVLANTDLQSVIIMRSDGNSAVEAVSGTQHPALRDWRSGIDLDLGSLFAAGVFE